MALLPGHIQYSPVFVGYFCFLFFNQHLVSAECKNICGTQFSRYLFSARSYTVIIRCIIVSVCGLVF